MHQLDEKRESKLERRLLQQLDERSTRKEMREQEEAEEGGFKELDKRRRSDKRREKMSRR